MTTAYRDRYVTIDSRLSRYVDILTLPSTAGSQVIPELADGEAWWDDFGTGMNVGGKGREYSVTGTTLSWTAFLNSTTLMIGIY
jgi:hypothetical protein